MMDQIPVLAPDGAILAGLGLIYRKLKAHERVLVDLAHDSEEVEVWSVRDRLKTRFGD